MLVGYSPWGGKESDKTAWLSRDVQETKILHTTWLSKKKKKKDVEKKGERERWIRLTDGLYMEYKTNRWQVFVEKNAQVDLD